MMNCISENSIPTKKRKKWVAEFLKEENECLGARELGFSVLHFISGNPRWFARIWRKDWVDTVHYQKEFGESYGRTKFEAYRRALQDLNTNVYKTSI